MHSLSIIASRQFVELKNIRHTEVRELKPSGTFRKISKILLF